MAVSLTHWIIFGLLIAIALGIDLWRSYRNPHAIAVKEALITSAGWIFLALLFNGWIYVTFGSKHALDFLTGYFVEKSLSVDNLFIFLLIFAHFKVPAKAKHLVLFYGVLGAIVMRGLMIWGGIELIETFDWIVYLFGAFLIYTGFHLSFKKETKEEMSKSRINQWLQKKIPFTGYHGESFLVKKEGKWMATPLLAALIMIEVSDLFFALDSVPAILGITTEPFIVYTSNIFAILGLRNLFFALEGMIQTFRFIHYALAVILTFIGIKMSVGEFFAIPTWVTFAVLVLSLSIAIGASLLFPKKKKS